MARPAVKFAFALSAIEIGIGAALHAFHVPMGGKLLSLNQGFLLSRASFTGATSRRDAIAMTHEISFSAACLKSLSPVGRKLTPMLAIAMQGLLFSSGQFVGGVSLVGHTAGIWLISLWATLQPVFLGWLFNGDAFLKALLWGIDSISAGYGRLAIIAFFGALFLLGFLLVLASRRMTEDQWLRFEERFSKAPIARKKKARWFSSWGVIVISVLFTAAFTYTAESPEARTYWIWLRPVGVAVLLSLIIRLIPPERWVRVLQRISPRMASALAETLDELRLTPNPDLRSAPPEHP